MDHEALRKLGKAAQRLAKLFGYTPETEASETPVQNDATFIEDTPGVGCPLPGTREDDGAPRKVTKPRWIETVARGPQRLFMVLYQSARAIARSRRYARRVGSISLHLPVDLLALHLGVDRTTIWRWAKELERKGLIARATHYGTLDGRTVATGTVWVVRLTPGRARITPEDLAHPWRNMEADRASGATAWAWIKAKRRPSLRVIVLWALGARYGPRGPAPGGGGASVSLYDIYLLPEASREELPGLITRLAGHLADLMGDPGGRRWYAGILWSVARGELRPQSVIDAVNRTLADVREGWARRPGALLNRRLAPSGVKSGN
jgi:hypothetical protein